jgi:ABC-2 type transport system permease protein
MMRGASVRRVQAMLVKEARVIMRDPATIVVAFVLPVVLMLLMGFGIDLNVHRIPIGLSLQDDGAAAQSLANSYQASRWFAIVRRGPVEQLRAEMAADRVRGIIVIPQDFGRRPGDARVQLLTDGSYPNPARLLEIHAAGVFQDWVAARGRDHALRSPAPADVATRFWFNPAMDSRHFLVPGAIAVVMTVVGSLLTALVVAREWESGAMEMLLATPLHISELLLAKLVPYFALGLIATGICIAVAVGIFAVPLAASPLAVLLVSGTYLLPALGQGLLISAVIRNQFVASQIALLLGFLPSLFLSGFVYEIASMPWPIQWLTVLVPARYDVPLLQTLFLVGDDWSMLWPNLMVLLGFGIVLLGLCRFATRRQLA